MLMNQMKFFTRAETTSFSEEMKATFEQMNATAEFKGKIEFQ